MLYFVKDNKIHRYPVPKRCTATYGGEKLRDVIFHDAEECVYCLGTWPGEKE